MQHNAKNWNGFGWFFNFKWILEVEKKLKKCMWSMYGNAWKESEKIAWHLVYWCSWESNRVRIQIVACWRWNSAFHLIRGWSTSTCGQVKALQANQNAVCAITWTSRTRTLRNNMQHAENCSSCIKTVAKRNNIISFLVTWTVIICSRTFLPEVQIEYIIT